MADYLSTDGKTIDSSEADVSHTIAELEAERNLLDSQARLLELEERRAERQHVEGELKKQQVANAMESIIYGDAEFIFRSDFPRGHGLNHLFTTAPFGTSFTYSHATDRREGRWWPFYETDQDVAYARGMSRFISNQYVPGVSIREILTSHIIGEGGNYSAQIRKGKRPKSDPKNEKTAGDLDSLLSVVQDCIDEFLEENKIIGDGEQEWFWRAHRDGDLFTVLTPCKEGFHGICDAREAEPEYVLDPGSLLWTEQELYRYYGVTMKWATNTTFGIHKYDHDPQRVLGYTISWDGGQYDYVPEKFCEHLKTNVDRNIARGITDFYPVWRWMKYYDRMSENTAAGASERAAISYITQHVQGTTKTQVEAMRRKKADYRIDVRGPTGNQKTYDREHKLPGTQLDLPNGQELATAFQSEPSPGFIEVVKMIGHIMEARWMLPSGSLSGTDTDGAMGSKIMAGSRFYKFASMRQGRFASYMAAIIWKVLRVAWERGKFERWGYAPGKRTWRDMRRTIELLINFPDIDTKDPMAQAQERSLNRQSGILSLRTAREEAGYDHETEEANIEEEGGPMQQGGMPGGPEGGMPPGMGAGGMPGGMPPMPGGGGMPGQGSQHGLIPYHTESGMRWRRRPNLGKPESRMSDIAQCVRDVIQDELGPVLESLGTKIGEHIPESESLDYVKTQLADYEQHHEYAGTDWQPIIDLCKRIALISKKPSVESAGWYTYDSNTDGKDWRYVLHDYDPPVAVHCHSLVTGGKWTLSTTVVAQDERSGAPVTDKDNTIRGLKLALATAEALETEDYDYSAAKAEIQKMIDEWPSSWRYPERQAVKSTAAESRVREEVAWQPFQTKRNTIGAYNPHTGEKVYGEEARKLLEKGIGEEKRRGFPSKQALDHQVERARQRFDDPIEGVSRLRDELSTELHWAERYNEPESTLDDYRTKIAQADEILDLLRDDDERQKGEQAGKVTFDREQVTRRVGSTFPSEVVHGTTGRSAKAFLAGEDLPEHERSRTLNEFGGDVLFTSEPTAPHQALMFGKGKSSSGGQRTLLSLKLKDGAEILDLGQYMVRRPKVGSEGTAVLDIQKRPPFTDDMADWLRESRAARNLPPLPVERVRQAVDPEHEGFDTELYAGLLPGYARDRGFAGFRTPDETVIVDRSVIQSARKVPATERRELEQRATDTKHLRTLGGLYTTNVEESREAMEALPSDTTDLTPSKARQILHDKQVHGKPLTDKQRRFMGAVASEADWTRYEGPRGGQGWKSTQTGRVVYQDAMPGEYEHDDVSPAYIKHHVDQGRPVFMGGDDQVETLLSNGWRVAGKPTTYKRAKAAAKRRAAKKEQAVTIGYSLDGSQVMVRDAPKDSGGDDALPDTPVAKWAEKRFKDPEHAANFVKWFGDSKVVDENGEPLVVYHGSREDFELRDSMYFTPHSDTAHDAFSGPQGSVTSVYVSLQNPLVLSSERMESATVDGTVDLAKQNGHDGLMTADISDEYAQVVPFTSSQVVVNHEQDMLEMQVFSIQESHKHGRHLQDPQRHTTTTSEVPSDGSHSRFPSGDAGQVSEISGAVVPGNLPNTTLYRDHRVAEAVNALSPIFDENRQVAPEIHERLLAIAREFLATTEIPDRAVTDIAVVGSAASTWFHPDSDVDLHVAVDIDKVGMPPNLVRDYLFDNSALYNARHAILIDGHEVEVFLEAEPAAGPRYSLLTNTWLVEPGELAVDQDCVAWKADKLTRTIDEAIGEGDHKRLAELVEKIRTMRRSGIASGGEASLGNQVFKTLRRAGTIDRLKQAARTAYDRSMSYTSIRPGSIIDWHGLQIHVENVAGDERNGSTMRCPYGEIVGMKSGQ